MDHPKNSINNLAIFSIFFFAFILLCSWRSKPSFSFQKHPLPTLSTDSSPDASLPSPKDELEEALSKASMVDKTVIITILNKAYVEPHNDQYPTMFDLFLEGFWVGEETRQLLNNMVVVAMDQTAYERCKFRRLNCYRLLTNGVNFTEEKLYMSADFIKMMWTRTLFLLHVLKRGYNFIFTDTDVIWLRSPFPKLDLNGTYDLQISTDKFNGDPTSELNLINTGFYHIRSNNKTISLFETWYNSRKNATGLKEQDVLANLMLDGVIKQLSLRVKFLDTLYFSGFCSDSKDVRVVSTVHANCCRSISAKIADQTAVLKDWNRFKHASIATNAVNSSSVETNNSTTAAFPWSRHMACIRSWRMPRTTVP